MSFHHVLRRMMRRRSYVSENTQLQSTLLRKGIVPPGQASPRMRESAEPGRQRARTRPRAVRRQALLRQLRKALGRPAGSGLLPRQHASAELAPRLPDSIKCVRSGEMRSCESASSRCSVPVCAPPSSRASRDARKSNLIPVAAEYAGFFTLIASCRKRVSTRQAAFIRHSRKNPGRSRNLHFFHCIFRKV